MSTTGTGSGVTADENREVADVSAASGLTATPNVVRRSAHLVGTPSTPASSNLIGSGSTVKTSTPHLNALNGSGTGFNSSDDLLLASHCEATCSNPLTNDSIMNDCGVGTGMEEVMAASKKAFDLHAAREAEAASRKPRPTFTKQGKGRGRAFGSSKRPYRANRAQPVTPYMESFIRHNLNKLKSLEAQVADLSRYSRRTSFVLCHPYRRPNYQDQDFPLWKQQQKMLSQVSLALGVSVGPQYLVSCHALGSTGWLLKCGCTMRGSLYEALLDNIGRPVAGFVINHHLPPADAQLFNRLQEFEGGDLIGKVQVNPRNLIIEVQYAGCKEWEKVVSWQTAPLAVQNLIGQLPAMISRPWVLPEGFEAQEGEVVASSRQVVTPAAIDTAGVSVDVQDAPANISVDVRDAPATSSADQESRQAATDTQDKVPSVASDHPVPVTPSARPGYEVATVEEF